MSALKRNEYRNTTVRMRSRWPHVSWAVVVLMAIAIPGLAQELYISDIPLYISTQVRPNIMLTLDNSGSMNNIVPDTPYDSSTIYLSSCPSGNLIPEGAQVELRISSDQPRIRYNNNDYPYGTGTNPVQKCFDSNLNYKAKLQFAVLPAGYLPAQYTGNYLNWYFNSATDPTGCSNSWSTSGGNRKPCTESRLMIAKSAAKSLVDSLGNVRLGLATYNTSTSGDGGSLLEIVGDLDDSKKTTIRNKIDALSSFGNTPLAETLSDVGHYFTTGHTDNLTLHPGQGNESTASVADVFNNHPIRNDSTQTISSPIQYSCQKSFVVYLTDGRPQGDQTISSHLADYDGDCVGASPACLTYDRKPGREYESAGSDYLDDVAQALYEMDLRPDLVDAHGAKNNLVTYLIGFADDQAKNDPLMRDASEQAGGEFFTAGNESELVQAFLNAAQNILGSVATAASIATNTTRLGTDTRIFQAKFNSADWSGQLVAYVVNPDGTVGAIEWDSDSVGKIPAHGSRHIYTWNGANGLEFAGAGWSNLASDQQDSLAGGIPDDGIDRLNWLRGDGSNEQSNGGPLRNRTKLLGDIVNSDPSFVGKSNFRYDRLPIAVDGQTTYNAFLAGTNGRRKLLYVGANDGMLHAFDAETGEEQFAYIPKAVFPNLAGLTNPDYTHKYFVDGSPYIGDAFIDDRWKTVLVGSTGAGGRSVFALDVSYLNLNGEIYEPDPDYFDETKVLWEFTDPDLGYTIGQPVVGRMPTGQWVAIFGNGYKSDNHKAFLFIVDLATGALIKKIDTAAGSVSARNGLATPALLANSNRTIEYAFAGDLLGNLWKFDLTSNNINNPAWGVYYKQGSTPKPLFTARNDSDQIQPITAPLEVLSHPNGGYLVLFGTGKYFEVGDNVVDANPPAQSFYGIRDNNARIETTDRTELQEQEITHELTAFDREVRVTSDTSVDYSTQKGWYMDMVSPVNSNEGERVVSSPLIRSGRIIFTTLIPSADPCEYGGTSWLMELDALTGGRLDYSVFDFGGDHLFNETDYITITIDGETIRIPASGLKSEVGIIKTPAVISAGEVEYKFFGGSTGEIATVNEVGSAQSGRQSWRQIR